MTTDAEQPVLADDASNPVTTLALAPEEKPATTIVLEHQRIALQGLMERQALHDPSTKSYKAIGARVAKLQQRYDNDLSAFQAKQLLRPTKRIEANLKRIKTLEKKKAATVQRVIAAVEKNVGSVKDKTRLTEAALSLLFERMPGRLPHRKQHFPRQGIPTASKFV